MCPWAWHNGRRLLLILAAAVTCVRAPWDVPQQQKRLVLDVTFESSKDYDITSAYAVRGWNTTEGHMKITVPTQLAKHGGRYGMQVAIVKAFSKNFHAQVSARRRDRSSLCTTSLNPCVMMAMGCYCWHR